MIDLKKLDEKDFVVVNKPPTDEELKEISAFIKSSKARNKRQKAKKATPPKPRKKQSV